MFSSASKQAPMFYEVKTAIAGASFAFGPGERVEIPPTVGREAREMFAGLTQPDADGNVRAVETEPLPFYVKRTVLTEGFRTCPPPEPPRRERLTKAQVCERVNVSPAELDVLVTSFGFPSPLVTRTYHPMQDEPEIAEFWNPEHVERWREKQGQVRNIFLGAHRG